MARRENTFRIDYANIPKKPSYDELHHFVGEVLGMKREEVKRLQCSRYLGCAFVKASSLEVAQRVVQEHDGKHEMEVDKKSYPLRLRMEDGGVDVKLHDLSEDVHDESITEFLKQYGDILSIRELLWDSKFQFSDVPTGVRVVRMVIKKNIPSTINIDSETTCVSYSGQLQSCRHCNELVHNGITCIQNKKLLLQKLHADKGSYVSVVKQAAAGKGNADHTTSKKPRQTSSKPAAVQQPNEPGSSTAPPAVPANTKPDASMPPPSLTTSNFPSLKPQQKSTDTIDLSQMIDEGHDTDSSTTSTSSKKSRSRIPHKKVRHNDKDNLNNEKQQ